MPGTNESIGSDISAMISAGVADGNSEETAAEEQVDETIQEGSDAESAANENTGAQGEEDNPEGEPAAGDTRLEVLERKLEEQNSVILKLLGQQGKKEEKKSEEEELPDVDIDNLISEEDYSKAMESHKAFNTLMKNVVTAAVNKTVKQMYKSLPQLVDSNVSRKVALNTAIQDMFKANRDLLPHRKILSYGFDELQSENPGLSPIEIIETRLPSWARKHLGLKAPANAKQGAKPVGKVLVAPGAGGRTPAPNKKLSTIGAEIADMARI